MSHPNLPLLVVEDNDEDFEMLELAFRGCGVRNPVFRCSTGEDALHFLAAANPRPGLVLLDLNLTGLDGLRVLSWMKGREEDRAIPVIVLSTSDNPKDVQASYRLGASGYLLKPVDLSRFEEMIRSFKAFWLEFMVLPFEHGMEAASL